jgi:DNA-binding transcriptional MerR regulator
VPNTTDVSAIDGPGSSDPEDPDVDGEDHAPSTDGDRHVSGVDDLRLTVTAVARRLGIAPATLRTWDRRYGLGPGDHTSGRHRRYGPADIARLELMQRALLRGASPREAARYALTSSDPTAPPPAPLLISGVLDDEGHDPDRGQGPDGESDQFDVPVDRRLPVPGAGAHARVVADALAVADVRAGMSAVLAAVDALGPERLWETVLAPVFASIDRRWGDTVVGAELCHRLAYGAAAACALVRGRSGPPSSARQVLLARTAGEDHNLPGHALAAALAQRQVRTQVIESGPSTDTVVTLTRALAPAALFVWAGAPRQANAATVASLAPATRIRPKVRVFVGGPGWQKITLPSQIEWLPDTATAAERLLSGMVL